MRRLWILYVFDCSLSSGLDGSLTSVISLHSLLEYGPYDYRPIHFVRPTGCIQINRSLNSWSRMKIEMFGKFTLHVRIGNQLGVMQRYAHRALDSVEKRLTTLIDSIDGPPARYRSRGRSRCLLCFRSIYTIRSVLCPVVQELRGSRSPVRG